MKDKRPFDLALVDDIEKRAGVSIKEFAENEGITWRKAFKRLARRHHIQLRLAPWYKEQRRVEAQQLDSFSALLKSKGIKFNQTV